MHAKDLAYRIKAKKSPAVIDVRSFFEFSSGHIPGAVHAPTWKILLKLAVLPVDKTAELVVTCEHGPRAQMALGLLKAYGYSNVMPLEGHMAGWRRVGLPVEK
jgi:hydroxyacylglutathione hydrolase